MTPERWQTVKALFDGALACPAEARERWLAGAAGGDDDLAREVASLLAALDQESGRFEQPAAVSLGGGFAVDGDGPAPGARAGPYRLVREVGRGGMGVVYEAYRDDDQFRQRVAIKTISRGMDSELILRRFRYERQILARLTHKNIAGLLDGGVTETGQPYFALEFIEGSPIDGYCDAGNLPLRDRLQLFRQICAAVQYAHQHLVIHRDLKPSNILVTADGTVKLLDFGIAKLLGEEEVDTQGLTQPGSVPLTTAYASPEQVRGDRVTTATDVFSLGVVLYKLVGGRHPFAYDAPGTAEIRRRIGTETPPPPSAAAPAARWRREVAGELDDIVQMALRKEPERRYASVEQLGEDLLRFLAGRTVVARADSPGYRLRKFVQRNRAAVSGGVLALLALLAGLGATIWQARVARRERDRARVAAETAQREQLRTSRISLFLQNMLGAADPSWYSQSERPGPATTIGDIIDAAGRRAEIELAAEPQVLAEVLRTLGAANQALRRLPVSREQLTRARDLHLQVEGDTSLAAARDEHELALAYLHSGDIAEAERILRQSLDRFRAAGDSASDEYGKVVGNMGLILATAGRAAEAEPWFRASAAHRRHLDSTSVANAILLGNLALVLSQQGKLDSAEPVYRRALAAFDGFPRQYFEKGWSLGNLAVDFILRGRPQDALPLAEEQIAHFTRLLGPTHPTVGYGWINLARTRHALGQEPEALRAARHAEGLFTGAKLPADHPDFARSDYIQGLILAAMGRVSEGERRLRNALAIRRRRFAPGSMHTTDAELGLGTLLIGTKRFAEAETLLTSAYRKYRDGLAPADPRSGQARESLVRLCEAGWKGVCGYRDSLPRE